MPFSLVNYLAGITTISLRKFIFSTAAGMLPGSVVYSYAGGRLAEIDNQADLLSPGVLIAFGLLAVVALLPAVSRRGRRHAG